MNLLENSATLLRIGSNGHIREHCGWRDLSHPFRIPPVAMYIWRPPPGAVNVVDRWVGWGDGPLSTGLIISFIQLNGIRVPEESIQ